MENMRRRTSNFPSPMEREIGGVWGCVCSLTVLNDIMNTDAPVGTKTASGPDAALAAALRMQEADARRQQLEAQLKQAPAELAVLQRRLDEEKSAYEARRHVLLELEVQRKDLDNRLKSAEAQLFKYRTQQLEVRKNDEYQALTHQIELAEAEVSARETEEIEMLIKMDEAKESLQAAAAELQRRQSNLEGEMALVRRRETQTRADLAAQEGAVETAAAAVSAPWRRAYGDAKNRAKRAPYIAPIEEHRCGGCHLRVSNEVSEAARHGGKPVHCDNCGRAVYWPA